MLRRERQCEIAAGQVGIKQRLHTKTIAIQKKALLAFVPESYGKHSVELVRERNSVLCVSMNDGLGVAGSPEAIAQGLEILAQLDVVKDLAVENHLHRAVLIRHGLVTTAQVND